MKESMCLRIITPALLLLVLFSIFLFFIMKTRTGPEEDMVLEKAINFQAHGPFSPFEDLTTEDLESVEVYYGNPDVFPSYSLSVEETVEFVEELRNIIIYKRVDPYQIVGGLDAFFSLNFSDGDSCHLKSNNPIFIIDNMGYKAVRNSSFYQIDELCSGYAQIIRNGF